MTRIQPLDLGQPAGSNSPLLETVQQELGFLPSLMRVLSHSPAALNGYLGLRAALKSGVLPAPLRERIAIAVAAINGCRCCLANHTHIGRCIGLPDSELDAAAQTASDDPAAAAALTFARALIETRGHIDDTQMAAIRAAGFDDAATVEIVAVVAANIFANFVNNLAHSAPDVTPLTPRASTWPLQAISARA